MMKKDESFNRTQESKKIQISRRGFLKAGATAVGAAGIGATVLDNKILTAAPLLKNKVAVEKESVCTLCQTRCTTKVQIIDGKVVNVYGNPENYWTEGAMCPKGKSLVELTHSPHRILHPLIKDGNSWKRISYEKAVDIVASRILKIKEAYPEDYAWRLALFMPLWDTYEAELMARLTLNMAGFPNHLSPGDGCIANTSTALALTLGSGTSPSTLNEALDSELLVLWGANISTIYPVYMKWIDRIKAKGIKIIYIDPRQTPTTPFADSQLMLRPGTDGALVLGAIRHIVKNNLHDRRYIAEFVDGFEETVRACEPYTVERVSTITWLSEKEIRAFYNTLSTSDRTMVWMGGSLSRNTNGINTVRGIIGLQAMTNNLTGTGKGLMTVRGGKPAGEKEFMAHYVPEGLAKKLHVRKVIYQMKKGNVDLLLLNGASRRYPDSNKTRAAIKKVGYVVYRGFFIDEEAELADLIIPPVFGFESEGSVYGAQRQMVWRHQAIAPLGECVPDWQFYRDLGRKLHGDKFPQVETPSDIYTLFQSQIQSWRGITLERLKKDPTGITWPCKSEHEDRRVGLYEGNKFATTNGKVNLYIRLAGPIEWKECKGSPIGKRATKKEKSYPLIFMQGKVVHHWQHTMTNWSSLLGGLSEGNIIKVHPDTVENIGIRDGDTAVLETVKGQMTAKVKITKEVRPGVVFTPSHTGPKSPFEGNKGICINTIIPGYWDKAAAQFNGFGCRLRRLT